MNALTAHLFNYALDHKIGIHMLPLKSDTPPLADVENRLVVINSKWKNQKELPIQIAHEIGHIMNEDSVKYSVLKNEGGANKKALEILIPEYFENIDIEDVNINQFMTDLCLPNYMEDEATKQIKEFYKTKI